MLEQPELGAPLIVTLAKAKLAKSDGTKDAKWETVEGAAVPEHLKSWMRWEYCYSDEEEPKEDDAWRSPTDKEVNLEEMKMKITPPLDNLHKYLHVCNFVADKWGESQLSVKLKRALKVVEIKGDLYLDYVGESILAKWHAMLNVPDPSDEELENLCWALAYETQENGEKAQEEKIEKEEHSLEISHEIPANTLVKKGVLVQAYFKEQDPVAIQVKLSGEWLELEQGGPDE